MKHEQHTSIHIFSETYASITGNPSEIAQVFLTIYHDDRQFSIDPVLPNVGVIDPFRDRPMHRSITDIAFAYQGISTDYARYVALQSCMQAALFYAIDTLRLSDVIPTKAVFENFNVSFPLRHLS